MHKIIKRTTTAVIFFVFQLAIIMLGLFSKLSNIINNNNEEDSSLLRTDEDLDIEEQTQQTSFDISELSAAVKKASEGALAVKTVATYRRYKGIQFIISLIF
jgi:hypothetical protein